MSPSSGGKTRVVKSKTLPKSVSSSDSLATKETVIHKVSKPILQDVLCLSYV